jgi:hypothetical protein
MQTVLVNRPPSMLFPMQYSGATATSV